MAKVTLPAVHKTVFHKDLSQVDVSTALLKHLLRHGYAVFEPHALQRSHHLLARGLQSNLAH